MAQIETRAHLVQAVIKTGDDDTDPELKLVFTLPVDDQSLKLFQYIKNNQREFYLSINVTQPTLPGMGEPVGSGTARVFPNGGRA